VTRSRAADDFATIRAGLRELRGERAEAAAGQPDTGPDAPRPASDAERRFKERRDGAPPPWVPTIFLEDAVVP
jgi:hypothetical protein